MVRNGIDVSFSHYDDMLVESYKVACILEALFSFLLHMELNLLLINCKNKYFSLPVITVVPQAQETSTVSGHGKQGPINSFKKKRTY
jgi:hypothetical protein